MVLGKLGHLTESVPSSSSSSSNANYNANSSTIAPGAPMCSIHLRRLLLKSTTKLGLTLECELKHKAKSHGKRCSVLIVQDKLFVLLLSKAGIFKQIIQEFPISFTDVAIGRCAVDPGMGFFFFSCFSLLSLLLLLLLLLLLPPPLLPPLPLLLPPLALSLSIVFCSFGFLCFCLHTHSTWPCCSICCVSLVLCSLAVCSLSLALLSGRVASP
jgi:hypothetical protein